MIGKFRVGRTPVFNRGAVRYLDSAEVVVVYENLDRSPSSHDGEFRSVSIRERIGHTGQFDITASHVYEHVASARRVIGLADKNTHIGIRAAQSHARGFPIGRNPVDISRDYEVGAAAEVRNDILAVRKFACSRVEREVCGIRGLHERELNRGGLVIFAYRDGGRFRVSRGVGCRDRIFARRQVYGKRSVRFDDAGISESVAFARESEFGLGIVYSQSVEVFAECDRAGDAYQRVRKRYGYFAAVDRGKGNFAAARDDFGFVAVGHDRGFVAVDRDGELVAVLDFAVRRAADSRGTFGRIVLAQSHGFVQHGFDIVLNFVAEFYRVVRELEAARLRLANGERVRAHLLKRGVACAPDFHVVVTVLKQHSDYLSRTHESERKRFGIFLCAQRVTYRHGNVISFSAAVPPAFRADTQAFVKHENIEAVAAVGE